jgi:hypothetical protein
VLIGTFQPSQRKNIIVDVYYGYRYGKRGYYTVWADRKYPVEIDELMGWYRHYTYADWRAGVRGHLDPRERHGELF